MSADEIDSASPRGDPPRGGADRRRLAAPHPLFECSVETRGDVVHIVPIGELDLDTTPHVEAQLCALHEAGFRRFVLDLRDTTFMDATGVHLALAWQERARREAFDFALVQGPPSVSRVFDAAGVADALRFVR
jgi:anti-anti-sigma factor